MAIRWEKGRTNVDFEEMAGSPIESRGYDGFSATRELKCAWFDRLTLMDDLLGYAEYKNVTYTIRKPMTYPKNDACFARSVPNIKPFGAPLVTGLDSDGLLAYEFALLTVEYDMDQPESYASEDFEASAEFITLPNANLYWDASQTTQLESDEAPGKILVMQDWVYRRDKMAYLPAQVMDYVGYVNSIAITSPKYGLIFQPETLLFSEPSLHEEKMTDGSSVFSVTFRMTHRPQGWNNFPKRGDTVTFQPIYNSGGTVEKPYPQADFLPLLKMTI